MFETYHPFKMVLDDIPFLCFIGFPTIGGLVVVCVVLPPSRIHP